MLRPALILVVVLAVLHGLIMRVPVLPGVAVPAWGLAVAAVLAASAAAAWFVAREVRRQPSFVRAWPTGAGSAPATGGTDRP